MLAFLNQCAILDGFETTQVVKIHICCGKQPPAYTRADLIWILRRMFSFMDSLQNLHAELVYFKIVYSGHGEVASKLVKELVLNLFHRLRYE